MTLLIRNIQKCFALAEEGELFLPVIFTYFDEQAKRSIKNLAIILGKEKLVELTGKRNVVFIKVIRLVWKKCYY